MRRALPLALLLLAGCAQSAGIGPSLGLRPIERRDLSEPVAAAAAPVAADAELNSQIEGLRNRARLGGREFDALLPRVQTAAVAAGAQGSESWIAAQQLLSALEAARAPTSDALGRTDALLAARVLGRQEAGLAELQAAQQEIAELSEAQQNSLDRLQARINR
jgi:hypothetical protein